MPTAPTFGAPRSDIAPLPNVDFGAPQSSAGLVSAGQALQNVGHVLDQQYKIATDTRSNLAIDAYKNEVDNLQMKLQSPDYQGVNANKVYDVITAQLPQIRSKYQDQLGDNSTALQSFNEHAPLIDQRFQYSTDNFVRVQNHVAATESAKSAISTWTNEAIRSEGDPDTTVHDRALAALDKNINSLGNLTGLPPDAVAAVKVEARGNIYANIVSAKIDLKQFDDARRILDGQSKYIDPKVFNALDAKITSVTNYDNAVKSGTYAFTGAPLVAGVPNYDAAKTTLDAMTLTDDQRKTAEATLQHLHGQALEQRNVKVTSLLNDAAFSVEALDTPEQKAAAMNGWVAQHKVETDALFSRQDALHLLTMVNQANRGMQDKTFNQLMALPDKQKLAVADSVLANNVGQDNYKSFMSDVNRIKNHGIINDAPPPLLSAADKAFDTHWLMSGGKAPKAGKIIPEMEAGRKVFRDRITRIAQASSNGVVDQKTIDAQAENLPAASDTRVLPLVPTIREGGAILPSGKDDMSQLFGKILGSTGDRRDAAETVKQWVDDAHNLGAYSGQKNSIQFTNALVESFVGAYGNKSAVTRTNELRTSIKELHPELRPDEVDKLVIDTSIERNPEATTNPYDLANYAFPGL